MELLEFGGNTVFGLIIIIIFSLATVMAVSFRIPTWNARLEMVDTERQLRAYWGHGKGLKGLLLPQPTIALLKAWTQ